VAKAYAARAARTVCETAIQVHGGIGNTWECLAHVYLRRALLATDVLGGTGANLARVLDHELVSRQTPQPSPGETQGGRRGLR
jgi:alkylation response protein AidB-like acyl-CoA dehydrogenase